MSDARTTQLLRDIRELQHKNERHFEQLVEHERAVHRLMREMTERQHHIERKLAAIDAS